MSRYRLDGVPKFMNHWYQCHKRKSPRCHTKSTANCLNNSSSLCKILSFGCHRVTLFLWLLFCVNQKKVIDKRVGCVSLPVRSSTVQPSNKSITVSSIHYYKQLPQDAKQFTPIGVHRHKGTCFLSFGNHSLCAINGITFGRLGLLCNTRT